MSSRWKRKKRRAAKTHEPKLKLVDTEPDAPIVAICIPSDDHVHAGFCLSLAQMVLHTLAGSDVSLKGITIQHVGASILPHSRYTLVKESQRHNATHLLFLDSDMTFPADTLVRLLRHDRDMVGINAMSRRPPHDTTAWVGPDLRTVTTPDSTGLEKAWRTGFAVVMLKAAVFDGMAAPYFGLEYVPEKDQFRGEDYVFFDAARAAGFDLYIDHDLSKQVNHMGGFCYNPLLQHAMSEMEKTA